MLLVALQDIPSTVGTIRAGQEFREWDEFNAREYILGGKAQAVTERKPNSRGWDGLQWDGETVVILASGPSLNEDDCELVRKWGKRTIVINTSWLLAPWADVLYACDARWWDKYIHDVRGKFHGQLWSQDLLAAERYSVKHIPSRRAAGLCKVPGVIHQGANSGYQAINLAYHAGAKQIVLLGFDMRAVGKEHHWHGDHPAGLTANNPYQMWRDNFVQLADDLNDAGVDVVNCTPKSALKCFRTATLEGVIREGSLPNSRAATLPA